RDPRLRRTAVRSRPRVDPRPRARPPRRRRSPERGLRRAHRARDAWSRKNARFDPRTATRSARTRLRRLRQSSLLAVALTAVLLTLFGGEDADAQLGETPPDAGAL